MATKGRPVSSLKLTPDERVELMSRRAIRKAPADEKLPIRIVLGCADGEAGESIAKRLKVSVQTISTWRRRYSTYRFAGLNDAPRSGRLRTVLDEQVQMVVDKVRQSGLERPLLRWLAPCSRTKPASAQPSTPGQLGAERSAKDQRAGGFSCAGAAL